MSRLDVCTKRMNENMKKQTLIMYRFVIQKKGKKFFANTVQIEIKGNFPPGNALLVHDLTAFAYGFQSGAEYW